MTYEIPTHFVQQFSDNVYHASQQIGSRLRPNGIYLESVVGDSVYIDNYGAVGRPTAMTSRHSDTPLDDVPFGRRKISLTSYVKSTIVDREDKLRILHQPESEIAMGFAASMGREIDRIIIDAALGNAYTGATGATAVALPAAQIIAVDNTEGGDSGSTGLTVGKLRTARKRLLSSESLMPGENVYFVTNAQGIDNLLATTQVTSADYNGVRALVSGDVTQFLGFNFIRSELLPDTTAGSIRADFAYTEKSLALAVGQDVRARVSERGDKNYANQVHFTMTMGAGRLKEDGVVKVLCAY